MTYPREHTLSLTLTAAACNAQMTLAPDSVVGLLIDAATEHANILDIGYTNLLRHNMAWVLSRLTYTLTEAPSVGQSLAFTTWIEAFNSHFSFRNFTISADGRVIGYARTVWAAIDIAGRGPAVLDTVAAHLTGDGFDICIPRKHCPIPPCPKLTVRSKENAAPDYTLTVSDLDSNRHLTTQRYIQLAVDTQPLGFYDDNNITRLDCNFIREIRYPATFPVTFSLTPAQGPDTILDAVVSEAAAIRITAAPKAK